MTLGRSRPGDRDTPPRRYGELLKLEIRVCGTNNVTSDREGCRTVSNHVYYAVLWEDNARNDDTDRITYVRPEEGIQ